MIYYRSIRGDIITGKSRQEGRHGRYARVWRCNTWSGNDEPRYKAFKTSAKPILVAWYALRRSHIRRIPEDDYLIRRLLCHMDRYSRLGNNRAIAFHRCRYDIAIQVYAVHLGTLAREQKTWIGGFFRPWPELLGAEHIFEVSLMFNKQSIFHRAGLDVGRNFWWHCEICA